MRGTELCHAELSEGFGIIPACAGNRAFHKRILAYQIGSSPRVRGTVILLHNHPGDSYPSLSDIYSAMMTEGVSGSLVSGHGGTVYYIEPIKLHGFEERYSILLEEAKQFTTEIERAQLIAFIRLEEENEVKKWYRVLKI